MEVIRDDQIIAVGGIDGARWRMMRRHFVHDFGAANRGYAKPLDADKSDFGFKPLIEIHRKNLLLISPSMCALAFFEAITRALRNAGYPNLENEIGSAVERVVADAFRAHGLNVTIQGGTYKMLDPLTGANQVGECDVVVETPEAIVFVETKKKPHRRVSATGDALANLIDLSGSCSMRKLSSRSTSGFCSITTISRLTTVKGWTTADGALSALPSRCLTTAVCKTNFSSSSFSVHWLEPHSTRQVSMPRRRKSSWN
jgi:hypothetical protein